MSTGLTERCVFRVTGPQSIERLEPLIPLIIPSSHSLCYDPLVFSTIASTTATDGTVTTKLRPAPQFVHFVWETTCEKTWRDSHNNALVINKLHNSIILEDKAHMAFLQLRMKEHYENVLPTYVANGAKEALVWAQNHWSSSSSPSSPSPSASVSSSSSSSRDSDWWVLKASSGNGGKDVWIISRENYQSVISNIMVKGQRTGKGTKNKTDGGVDVDAAGLSSGCGTEELVIQKYVSRPLLYQSKKFHFRCYSVIRADMSALVYQMAYILTAGYHYNKSTTTTGTTKESVPGESVDDMDPRKLITNLSVNKHIDGYPGQVPCNVLVEYPNLFHQICLLWKAVALAATPFMKIQRNTNHFEFFGIDVVADESGRCWLLEINRLPGLESSHLNKAQEDTMYDTMMTSLLHIVLQPIKEKFNVTSASTPASATATATVTATGTHTDTDTDTDTGTEAYGLWNIVLGPTAREEQLAEQGRVLIHSGARTSSTSTNTNAQDAGSATLPNTSASTSDVGKDNTWKNTFSWRAFTKRGANRDQVLVSASIAASATAVSSKEKQDKSASNSANSKAFCSASGCDLTAPLRCSRCKSVSYCTAEHQKLHWSTHKGTCKLLAASSASSVSDSSSNTKETPPPQAPTQAQTQIQSEHRISRCMFCGDSITMTCEEDAHKHMTVCPALQEQLSSSDQFTIPKNLRDKGINMQDVKNAPTI